MYFPNPYEPVVARLVASLDSGTLGAWAGRLFASDAVLHVDAAAPLGGLHDGADAIAGGFFGALERASAGAATLRGFETRLDGRAGIVRYVLEARAGGRELVDRQELRLRFADGRIAEAWLRPGSREAFDRFFASAEPTTSTSRRQP